MNSIIDSTCDSSHDIYQDIVNLYNQLCEHGDTIYKMQLVDYKAYVIYHDDILIAALVHGELNIGYGIALIAVKKEYQRQGYGIKLMNHYLKNNDRQEHALLCRNNNVQAVNLYKKTGWIIESKIPNYYFCPTDIACIFKYYKSNAKYNIK